MSKKILAVMMATVMVTSLTACGKTDSADSINPDKYVKLCDLESLEIPVDSYTFTDEDVQNQMQEEFEYYVDMADIYDYHEITDRTDVQTGDFCNIDYEGTKDGVAFDGGTAQGHNLEIGSGSFIDGFEEGLIGHNVSEELDLNLTFPEDYTNEELAGQDVVFHVKINKIQTRSMPQMTDETVAKLDMDYSAVADLEKEVREYLQESCDDETATAKNEALWTTLMDKCEITEIPQTLIDSYTEEIRNNAQSYADGYGVELEEFITSMMQMDMETFEAQIADSAKSAAEQELIISAIAKKAGLKVTKDEAKSRAEAEYAEYQYESVDAFLEDVGEENYEKYLLQEKVEEYLDGVVKYTTGETINLLESYGSNDDETFEEDGDVEELDLEDAAEGEDVIELEPEDTESTEEPEVTEE